jgi:hypothetical protein
MVLLVPPAVIFAVASYKCGFSHHSRYIMPCVPFVFVWLGQFGIWMEHLSRWLPSPRFGEKGWGRREPVRGGAALGVVSGLLLAWTIGSSLYVYPHSLSYFNELAGGPKNGPAHLLNSNVDWGQDLLFLEKWAEQNAGGLPVYTAFYNLYNPFDLEIAGIEPWPFRREDENWESDRTVVARSTIAMVAGITSTGGRMAICARSNRSVGLVIRFGFIPPSKCGRRLPRRGRPRCGTDLNGSIGPDRFDPVRRLCIGPSSHPAAV